MKRLITYPATFFRSVRYRGIGHTIKLIREELAFDRKYKTHTKTVEHLEGKTLAAENDKEFYHYQGASYFVLKEVLAYAAQKHKSSGFIDFGCGKGKAMIVAAECGFTSIKGVELAKEILVEGQKNLEIVKTEFPTVKFKMVHGSATDYQVSADDSVFYFFNPFGEEVFEKVLSNLLNSHKSNPREMIFIYLNPKFRNVFDKTGFKLLKEFKAKHYTEALIYQYA